MECIDEGVVVAVCAIAVLGTLLGALLVMLANELRRDFDE